MSKISRRFHKAMTWNKDYTGSPKDMQARVREMSDKQLLNLRGTDEDSKAGSGSARSAQIKMINRKMETLLDRDEEDFNLTVSSPDLNRPLKIWRQYKKNEGRFLKVKYDDREDEGQLIEVAEEYIVLSVPQKKKSDPNKELKIEFTALTEAKVAIKFK